MIVRLPIQTSWSVRFYQSIYLSNREIREYPNLIFVWSSSPVPLSAVVLLPPSYIASPCRCTLNALLSPSSRCCGGGGRCAMFPSPSSQVLPFSLLLLLFLIDFISRLPRRALTGNRTCLCIKRQESDSKLETPSIRYRSLQHIGRNCRTDTFEGILSYFLHV